MTIFDWYFVRGTFDRLNTMTECFFLLAFLYSGHKLEKVLKSLWLLICVPLVGGFRLVLVLLAISLGVVLVVGGEGLSRFLVSAFVGAPSEEKLPQATRLAAALLETSMSDIFNFHLEPLQLLRGCELADGRHTKLSRYIVHCHLLSDSLTFQFIFHDLPTRYLPNGVKRTSI